MNTVRNEELIQEEVLDNIIESISDKLSTLKISLRKLSIDANVDYHTLKNIFNKSTLPNLRILIKISNYLGMTPADLISQETTPQEIPILSRNEVISYLKNKDDYINYPTYKLTEYIHPNTFAINEISLEFIIQAEITYICFHGSTKTSFEENQVYLAAIDNQLQFIRIESIQENYIKYILKNNLHTIEVNKIKYIATVVSMKMSERLI
jgi:lambda repressor-like predicted transcriptional regulator